ncbi:MAG TPA: RnfABCDGE type electron transport complex subunit B [Spirochaetota bacterium]|nr:RnfABCDGE type electron transport complex subunit B [Spirochaetota bacterium]HPP51272.1 RnfABCDGE type electron transport complex subunit B [Spirochaetota bacterium]
MLEILFPSVPSIISITVLSLACGILLSLAKVLLKVEKDPRVEKVIEALPGANCGACGFPGCAGYATNIVEHGAAINMCPVGGPESVKKISEIMGIEAEAGVKRIARVHCQGGVNETKIRFMYDGPHSCRAAQLVMGGFKVCEYGCLGLGDCVRACPFDAIHLDDRGLPFVDAEKCTGCGNCVEACPRDIISLLENTVDVYVICRNKQKAPVMKLGCSVGCTACKRCEKACREEVFKDNPDIETAIKVENFLAGIDYELCINCGRCAEVCPQKVIDFKKIMVIKREAN